MHITLANLAIRGEIDLCCERTSRRGDLRNLAFVLGHVHGMTR